MEQSRHPASNRAPLEFGAKPRHQSGYRVRFLKHPDGGNAGRASIYAWLDAAGRDSAKGQDRGANSGSDLAELLEAQRGSVSEFRRCLEHGPEEKIIGARRFCGRRLFKRVARNANQQARRSDGAHLAGRYGMLAQVHARRTGSQRDIQPVVHYHTGGASSRSGNGSLGEAQQPAGYELAVPNLDQLDAPFDGCFNRALNPLGTRRTGNVTKLDM